MHCRCLDCQNRPGNPEREKKIGKHKQKKKVAVAQAAVWAHQSSRMSGSMAMMSEGGRAYFQQTQSPPEQDVEATKAAAAAVVAGGVDLFLPKSAYTVPMTLKNGIPYAGLSFGTTSTPSSSQQDATPVRRNTSRPPRVAQRGHWKWETDLQRLWRWETERARLTLDWVKKELNPMAKELNTGFAHADPIINYRAQASMEGLERDMIDIRAAIQKAEVAAIDDLNCTKEAPIRTSSTTGNPTGDDTYRAAQLLDKERLDDGSDVTGQFEDAEEITEKKASIGEACQFEDALVEEPLAETAISEVLVNESAPKDGPQTTSHDAQGAKITDISDHRDLVDPASTTQGDRIPMGVPLQKPEAEGDDTPPREQATSQEATQNPSKITEGATMLDGEMPTPVSFPSNELDDSVLLCDEKVDESNDNVSSEEAIRQLTILATQDAALLSQLAIIVRRKTLELTKERIRLVENARNGSVV